MNNNNNFEEDDPSWIQSMLLAKFGGLRILSAVQLAPSDFLASAAACTDLDIHQIAPMKYTKSLQ